MRNLLFVIGLVGGASAFAQTSEIAAEGKVMDALTHKGVKAKIFYKSYPTGSITGRFNDSTFSFPIFGSSKYLITADADGYITGNALVDPKDSKPTRITIRRGKKGERERVAVNSGQSIK